MPISDEDMAYEMQRQRRLDAEQFVPHTMPILTATERMMMMSPREDRSRYECRDGSVEFEPGRLLLLRPGRDGRPIAELNWARGRLYFSGDADQGAVIFMNYLKHDISMDQEIQRRARSGDYRAVERQTRHLHMTRYIGRAFDPREYDSPFAFVG